MAEGLKHIQLQSDWKDMFTDKSVNRSFCNEVIAPYLVEQRWYAGKSSQLKYLDFLENQVSFLDGYTYHGIMLEANFVEAFVQRYSMLLSFVPSVENIDEKALICSAEMNGVKGYVIDSFFDEEFRKVFYKRLTGEIEKNNPLFKVLRAPSFVREPYQSSRFVGVEQSNTSIVYNEKYIMKFFRRIYDEPNPDFEMNQFLAEETGFKNMPNYCIGVTWRNKEQYNVSIAFMQELVPNKGDAWELFTGKISKILNTSYPAYSIDNLPIAEPYTFIKKKYLPAALLDLVGMDFFDLVADLAVVTAKMHVALGSDSSKTAFKPSHYNSDYIAWQKNRLIYQFENRINLLENTVNDLPENAQILAQKFLSHKKRVRKALIDIDQALLTGERIRIHGDYHLGQVLYSEEDEFCVIDFEGEPESTIHDRHIKQPPIKDVAGMLRSFNYAIYATIFNENINGENKKLGEILYTYICGYFLESYNRIIRNTTLNIGYQREVIGVLKFCLLEKAIYELGYELNSRKDWAIIPLKGIDDILN